jgi:hypothetical protein
MEYMPMGDAVQGLRRDPKIENLGWVSLSSMNRLYFGVPALLFLGRRALGGRHVKA